jgi:hypothetical protein
MPVHGIAAQELAAHRQRVFHVRNGPECRESANRLRHDARVVCMTLEHVADECDILALAGPTDRYERLGGIEVSDRGYRISTIRIAIAMMRARQ